MKVVGAGHGLGARVIDCHVDAMPSLSLRFLENQKPPILTSRESAAAGARTQSVFEKTPPAMLISAI